jgi:hypothetical protein
MDDRVLQDEFTMTQEFLAFVLGVRRQTCQWRCPSSVVRAGSAISAA